MSGRRTFRSDNNAGLCPEALQALIDANDGSHQTGYGDDDFTDEAVRAFRGVFGDAAAVFFVATGGAANALAVAALTEPWQQILCHAHSHLNMDESTGPERITHCRVTPIESPSSKLTPQDIERHGSGSRGDVHQPQPGVVTISNPTEFGTVYSPQEVRAICETAHGLGYRVHVDGARFANAVAHLGCDPRDIANAAGVDALSFGGTKNGLAYGEAVLFFAQGDRVGLERAQATFPFHRKGTGHLLSKHRFLAASFTASLREQAWLRHASHANSMATLLSDGLARLGFDVRFPTESNGVFVVIPDVLNACLKGHAHEYYMFGDASWSMARLMCSFDTQRRDVEHFLTDAATACRLHGEPERFR